MSTAYPIVIRINPKALEYFRGCEEGSWEDYQYNQRVRDDSEGEVYGKTHGYQILTRHAGKIEVRNAGEAAEIYYRACSGTFQLSRASRGDDDAPCYLSTARRIANALREAAREHSDVVVRLFPAPDGY